MPFKERPSGASVNRPALAVAEGVRFGGVGNADTLQRLLLKVVPAFIFLNLLFGDYCDYYSRVYNPLPIPYKLLAFVLLGLKLVIAICLILCLVRDGIRQARIPAPLVLFLLFSIALSIVHSLYPDRVIAGSYIEFGAQGLGNQGVQLHPSSLINYMSRNVDLLVLVSAGAVISDRTNMLRAICSATLLALPFHLINGILQFSGFFITGIENSGAVFFSTSSEYVSIGQRMTGLFVSPFYYSIYLAFAQYLLYLIDFRYKHLLSVLLLAFNVMSLTRSGIVLWFVVECFCLKDYWEQRDWRYIALFSCLGATILLFVLAFFDVRAGIFQRLFQPLNAEQNFSFMSRTTVPFLNLGEMLFHEPVLLLFGVGNVTTIGADSNLVSSIYQEGVLYTIFYYGIMIAMARRCPKRSNPILAILITSAVLFSGSNQTVIFIAYFLLSLFLYEGSEQPNMDVAAMRSGLLRNTSGA